MPIKIVATQQKKAVMYSWLGKNRSRILFFPFLYCSLYYAFYAFYAFPILFLPFSRSTSSLDNTVGNNSANTEVEHREKALLIREKIQSINLLEAWDEFCHTSLREVLDHQTMGSYEMPPVEITTGSPGNHITSHTSGSEEGMLKLGVDLEAFLEEDEHIVDGSHGVHSNEQLFAMTFREGDFLHHVSCCCIVVLLYCCHVNVMM